MGWENRKLVMACGFNTLFHPEVRALAEDCLASEQCAATDPLSGCFIAPSDPFNQFFYEYAENVLGQVHADERGKRSSPQRKNLGDESYLDVPHQSNSYTCQCDPRYAVNVGGLCYTSEYINHWLVPLGYSQAKRYPLYNLYTLLYIDKPPYASFIYC
jgi:hypothetical protein